MSRKFGGMKRYESLLQTICNVEDFNELPEDEWQGCIGVACIMAVMEGVTPSINSLSRYLEIPHTNLDFQTAFDRLKVNSIFGSKYRLSGDLVLKGKAQPTEWRTPDERSKCAWCILAGVASGHCGLRTDTVVPTPGDNLEKVF